MTMRKTNFAEHMDDPENSPELAAQMKKIGPEVDVISLRTDFSPTHVIESETVRWADGSIHTSIRKCKRGYYFVLFNQQKEE
jgi:hypothetical protein